MLPANKFINHISNYLKVDPKSHLDEYVSVLPFPWIMEQTYGVGFNLLSVGLHSYGFTDGAALNLFLFITFEIIFGMSIYGLIKYRNRF